MAPTPCPTGRFLNALLNTASGATWVSIHHGGGVGMGFAARGRRHRLRRHARGGERIARVLWNDPARRNDRHAGMQVVRRLSRSLKAAAGARLPMVR